MEIVREVVEKSPNSSWRPLFPASSLLFCGRAALLLATGEPAKRQQEQILLRLKAGRARHGVPFPDELANAVAQFCQRLVFRSGDFFRHETTISHCDIYFHSTARADSGKLLVEKLLKLQRFAKRFLRLEMLVAVAFVKLVRALANYVGTHRHALATIFARPFFGGRQQQRPSPQAAVSFCHD